MSQAGYLCIVLHAHLPYVRHPEHPEFFEERWLFEAVRECYLPLIRLFQARAQRPNPAAARLTFSLSPTLCAMLDDPLLRRRTSRYLDRVASLADDLTHRFRDDETLRPLLGYYQELSARNRETWRACDHGLLVDALIEARQQGVIELITTAATHAFLPAWKDRPANVRSQIVAATKLFSARTGSAPPGFWLPECGYYPGLEAILADQGIRYFFVESHGIWNARPRPPCGVYAPVMLPGGVAAFGRDPESSHQVWSSHGGYPGDPDYREYYRDLGATLPGDVLGTFMPDPVAAQATGFKLNRITGPGEHKAAYHPDQAAEKARRHARDFAGKKRVRLAALPSDAEMPPVLVAPYDAELFGHWWFEGPLFLEALMDACADDKAPAMITPSDYLDRHRPSFHAIPSASTWGAKGYHEVWMNDATAWIYPHLFRAADREAALAAAPSSAAITPALRARLLAQAGRELMLAQASDWPFMMTNGSHVDYAEKRIRDHLVRFHWIANALAGEAIDTGSLAAMEAADPLFRSSWRRARQAARAPGHKAGPT